MVSGDSRNCGDVVMPAIARGAAANNASFYWHLGDFRAIYLTDQDYAQEHNPKQSMQQPSTEYLASAWQDFIDNQLKPFGNLPVFLSFGNHEVIPPMTKPYAIAKFGYWLDRPEISLQRLKDDHSDETVKAYYHWQRDGIDFISLDNSADKFGEDQLEWLQAVLTLDRENDKIRAVVVGMHEALPESISVGHSMSQTLLGEETGIQVYRWLLEFKRQSKKSVYVLASHSHFYMPGIYDTEYWRKNGGVLPGWIVGTAGAERYALPDHSPREAKTCVYGYMVATVSAAEDDPVHFEFKELNESDVPTEVVNRFGKEFVHACWVANPNTCTK